MARELYTIFKVLQKENFIRNVNKNHQIWLKVNAPHTKTEDMLIDTFGPLRILQNNDAIKYISHYKKYGRNDYGRTGLWTNWFMAEMSRKPPDTSQILSQTNKSINISQLGFVYPT
jgi:hypothetical protein